MTDLLSYCQLITFFQKLFFVQFSTNKIFLLCVLCLFEQNYMCSIQINYSRPLALLKQVVFNAYYNDVSMSTTVANLENVSFKISSHDASNSSRQFSNSETSSKSENCLNSVFSFFSNDLNLG